MGAGKSFQDLHSDVVEKGLCVTCGTCEAVCPVGAIEVQGFEPHLVGDCIQCGLCYSNCPAISFEEALVEERVFGRRRGAGEELVGVVREVYQARAKLKEALERGQDGGVVTALLVHFLRSGGEAAIVAGLDPSAPWLPTPVVARTEEEVLEAAGTKYTPSPSMAGLGEAVKELKLGRVAVVATPCGMRGLALATFGPRGVKRLREAVALRIGLFCMESFDHRALLEFLESQGVNPEEVTKFEIRKGRFIAWSGERRLLRVKLGKVKDLIRPACRVCGDFASEFADISVGNVGSPGGYSTVITRSERGEEFFQSAVEAGLVEAEPLEGFEEGDSLVHRLAEAKKSHQ